jgi:signal transduction histidine kinase
MARSADLEQRLSFVGLRAEDLEALRSLREPLEKHADAFVGAFYRHLLSFQATRDLLRDAEVKNRLLESQRAYLLSLAGPVVDEAFVAERRRIGEVHERVGLEPRFYLGAYALYLSLLTPIVLETFARDASRGADVLVALQKLLLLDAQLAVETYIERHERELQYLTDELSREGRQLASAYETQRSELRETASRARVAEELASVGKLVAGLAHEIGTPMSVIQGHAKLLEPAVASEDALWRLRTIQEQIARISRIIQTLLNLARPRRSRRVAVNLGPLLEATLSFLAEKLRHRGIRVERDLRNAPSILGDPERLQQLFLNLFLNAADAMPDGGELRIGLEPTVGGGALVRVADTGVGISEADLPRIFEPFFTSKPAGEGNGLGLMVAQGIVKDHGGSICVESRLGSGTEFRIECPPPEGNLHGSGESR